MIQVVCDDCEARFEVESAVEGQKVRCPQCGDVHIVRLPTERAPEAKATRRDRALEAGYPAAFGEEAEVLVVKGAMLRARPLTFLALVLVLLTCLWGTGQFYSSGNTLGMAACAVVALLVLLALGWWQLIRKTTSLRITTKRTVETVGLFSKATSEILHKDIRNFTVTQSFWQRLWRVGTIGIDSAAEDVPEIIMHDVPSPQEVHRVIDLYRPM